MIEEEEKSHIISKLHSQRRVLLFPSMDPSSLPSKPLCVMDYLEKYNAGIDQCVLDYPPPSPLFNISLYNIIQRYNGNVSL